MATPPLFINYIFHKRGKKMENIFEYDDTMSFESNYRMWKHMNDKEHRDNGEEVYDDTTSKSVFVQMWGYKNNG